MKRRTFLKNAFQLSALSSLPILQSHFSPSIKIKPYQVFWIHLEGAPIREVFDFWPDPYNQFSTTELEHKKEKLFLKFGEYLLPKLWKENPQSKFLLNHWLSVRGIALNGPHLKQSRSSWFRKKSDPEKSIIESFNESFQRAQLGSAKIYSLDGLTRSLYEPLLKNQIQELKTGQLKELFKEWKDEANQKNKLNPLQLGIIRSPSPLSKKFEDFDRWDQDTKEEYLKFYDGLIKELTQFALYLDQLDQFQHSALLITSDRRKVPTSLNRDPELEAVWEGGNFSLISGALNGPVVLGDIYREHPKYKESYPMTWGASPHPYSPAHIHQLIMDLCLAGQQSGNYNPREENPWVVPRSLQGLYIKGLMGRVI